MSFSFSRFILWLFGTEGRKRNGYVFLTQLPGGTRQMPSDKNSQKNFRMPEVLFFFHTSFFFFFSALKTTKKKRDNNLLHVCRWNRYTRREFCGYSSPEAFIVKRGYTSRSHTQNIKKTFPSLSRSIRRTTLKILMIWKRIHTNIPGPKELLNDAKTNTLTQFSTRSRMETNPKRLLLIITWHVLHQIKVSPTDQVVNFCWITLKKMDSFFTTQGNLCVCVHFAGRNETELNAISPVGCGRFGINGAGT
jgi:hypothetical protein